MRSLLLLSLLAAGCSYYPFPYESGPYHYQADCLEVTSDRPLDADALAGNVAISRAILDEGHILKAADFCATFRAVPIAIRAGWVDGEENDFGGFSRLSGIELSRDGSALVHEELHALDFRKAHWMTFDHAGWDSNGYRAADDQFQFRAAMISK